MLHVVFDANSLGIRAPLAGNPQRLLLEAAAKGQLVLVVPELVVREALNKWRELVGKEVERLQAPVRELAKYNFEVGLPTPERLDEQAAALEVNLRRALAAPGVLVPGFPKTPHEQVAARALARRKPFDGAGKDGYRDVLLWETVVELAAEHEVVLLSRDGRAFADADGKLARVLSAEVKRRAGLHARVELVGDAHDVVARLAQQDQVALEQVRELVRQRSFRVLLEEALDDALSVLPLDPRQWPRLAPPGTISDAWVSSLQAVGKVTAVSAYTVPSGDALVQLDVDCGIVAAFNVSSADARALPSADAWRDPDTMRSASEPVPMAANRLVTVRLDAAIALPAGRLERLAVLSVTLAEERAEFVEPDVVDDEPRPEDDFEVEDDDA